MLANDLTSESATYRPGRVGTALQVEGCIGGGMESQKIYNFFSLLTFALIRSYKKIRISL